MTGKSVGRGVFVAALAAGMAALPSIGLADVVLFDFESGAQGWGAFGPLTTDSGTAAIGLFGQGRYHVADFDLSGWGIVSVSPPVDLSAFEGLRVAARLVNVPGYPAFSGTPEMQMQLAIGYATWSAPVLLSDTYQLFSVAFDELEPDGEVATAPITPAELADPELQIKLVMFKRSNTGVAELDFDQVTGLESAGITQVLPGTVLYDFNTNGDFNECYPDDWTFFGYPQTDFGLDRGAEDGTGAFQAADWTACDMQQLPQCVWVGSGIGLGLFEHEHCVPGGVDDVKLDLSLGTGLSIRMKVNLNVSFGGTEGARVQLQMEDDDGTVAVLSRVVSGHPTVNRAIPVPPDWTTITIPFAALDSAFDDDDSVAGAIPGLNLSHITRIRLMWRRYEADGVNVFEFDKITLVDEAFGPWADRDLNGTVDLADFAVFQGCFENPNPPAECAPFDADRDGDVDLDDLPVFMDCMQGPDVAEDYYPWCY